MHHIKICEANTQHAWGKFIIIKAYIRKGKSFQINNLKFQLKKLEKKSKLNPKAKRR